MKLNSLNYFFLYQVPYYLVILLPLLLITGSFLPDLAISFVALSFIIYSINDKKYI